MPLDRSPLASPSRPRSPLFDLARLSKLLEELPQLFSSVTSADEFDAIFLDKLLPATGCNVGAVWQRIAEGPFQLRRERHFDRLGLNGTDKGVVSHQFLLEDAARSGRTIWVPTYTLKQPLDLPENTNLSAFDLILAPILVNNKVAGILELGHIPTDDHQLRKVLIRIASELAKTAASRMQQPPAQKQNGQQQQQFWIEFEAFTAQIHRSLDPEEVAYLIANDGKKLFGCDQVSVGLRLGNKCQPSAVSGAVTVEKRSPLIQAMAQLFEAIKQWREPVVYAGVKDETLPPRVAESLNEYLAASNCTRLAAIPLKDDRRPEDDSVCGVVMAECYDTPIEGEVLLQRLQTMQKHLAPAVANALQYQRLPLRWLTHPLAHFRDGIQGRQWGQWLVVLTLFVAIVAGLTLVQLPFRTEATGQLVPKERRIVYANLNGKVLQLTAQPGDWVGKGQELLFIEDLDTQLKVDQLAVKMSALNQKLAYLDEQLGRNLSAKERGDFLAERIKVQFEQRKAKVEHNLLLAEIRDPRKAPVVAPLAGQVLTYDAKEKLLGKTVKLGDPLLRIAEITGVWEVELFIPERDTGRIRTALAQSPSGLPVDLLLSSDPTRTFKGQLTQDGLGGETIVQDGKVVLTAKVKITDEALVSQLQRMPVGVEVHARIGCGQAPVGYVWFSEVWNFLYQRVIF